MMILSLYIELDTGPRSENALAQLCQVRGIII